MIEQLKKAGIIVGNTLGFESGEDAREALAEAIKATEGFEEDGADSLDIASMTVDAIKAGLEGGYFDTAKGAKGGKGEIILSETYGAEGKTSLDLDDAAKAFEGLVNTPLDNLVANSIKLNVAVAKQSDFSEAFFKTVYVKPGQKGISFKTTMEFAYVPYMYDTVKGKVQFEKVPVMDLLAKNSKLLNGEGVRIYPVLRDETAEYFEADDSVKKEVEYRGEKVTTAPLKLNKALNIKELAQSANMITNAPFTEKDELSHQAEVIAVYAKDKNGKLVAIPTKGVAGAAAVYTAEGDVNHDLTWSFTAKLVLDDDTKDTSGAALSTGLPAGSTVVIEFQVSGTGHTETGNVTIGQLSKRVVKAVDSNGADLTLTDDQKAYIESIALDAFDGEFFITNEALLSEGTLITKETTNVTAGVFIGTPISSEASILRNTGAVDVVGIQDLASKVGIALENKAIRTLVNFANELEAVLNSGNEFNFKGIGRDIAKPTCITSSINIAAVLNTLTDSGKKDDIKARVQDLLEDIIVRLAIESGYETSVDAVFGTTRAINVVVGAHTRLLPYLPSAFTIGNRFNVTVVTKTHEDLEDSIYISFAGVDRNALDNQTMDKFRFGNHLLAPSLVGVTTRDVNGRTINFNTVFPVSGHHVNLPVIGKVTVTGIANALETKIR